MKTIILIIIVSITIFFPYNKLKSQGLTCATALPFFTGTTYEYPASTNNPAEVGPDYSCLLVQPNPCWYYLRISHPGNLILSMQSTALVDIDFCCWGPFSTFSNICGGLTSSKVVDCLYQISSHEIFTIPHAKVGEYYMVCITNYSGLPTNIIFSQIGGTATTGDYNNSGFELGNFNGWQGYKGTDFGGVINFTDTAIINGYHNITSGIGLDTLTGNNFPVVAPNGGIHSFRLGSDTLKNYVSRLSYTMDVTAKNNVFYYWYATVIEDQTYPPVSNCNFIVDVVDTLNNIIDSSCYYKNVSSSTNTWKLAGLDLSTYIGKKVVIRFTIYNGTGSAISYAYIDAGIMNMGGLQSFCKGNTSASITAPPGFTYSWTGPDFTTTETTQSVIINNAAIGDIYTCFLTNNNGCTSTFLSELSPTLTANYANIFDIDRIINFYDMSVLSENDSIVNWYWYFGDGSESNQKNPVHQYDNDRTYYVKFVATSLMGCVDSLERAITVNLGINDLKSYFPAEIYPNPFNDFLNINYTLNKPSKVNIEIVDILGNKVNTIVNYKQTSKKYNLKYNYQTLPKGIYLIKFDINDTVYYKKIIKN